MIVKSYIGKTNEISIGIIIEGEHAGKPSYYLDHEIKEVQIDGQWVANPGYDLAKVKSQKLSEIESKILDVSMNLDKAISLNLQTQVSALTLKLSELTKQKEGIDAL